MDNTHFMSTKSKMSDNSIKKSKMNNGKTKYKKTEKKNKKVVDSLKPSNEQVLASTSITSEYNSDSENEVKLADDESTAHESSGSEEDFPRKKKSSISKHDDGSELFSSAVNNILSSHLKSYDRKDPIFARNKKVLRQNNSDKLELKAKKALLVEKKQLLNRIRNRDILLASSENANSEDIRRILDKERKLRKIAQKGVVKLFNAILSTQIRTEKEVSETLGDVKNTEERKHLITEISKEKFLDLVKAAGNE